MNACCSIHQVGAKLWIFFPPRCQPRPQLYYSLQTQRCEKPWNNTWLVQHRAECSASSCQHQHVRRCSGMPCQCSLSNAHQVHVCLFRFGFPQCYQDSRPMSLPTPRSWCNDLERLCLCRGAGQWTCPALVAHAALIMSAQPLPTSKAVCHMSLFSVIQINLLSSRCQHTLPHLPAPTVEIAVHAKLEELGEPRELGELSAMRPSCDLSATCLSGGTQ